MTNIHEFKEHIARCSNRLNLKLPTTREELKAAFKIAAQTSHPDKGGNAEDFRLVKDAHTFLLENLETISVSGDFKVGTTTNGRLLSELGHGLDARTNGKECNRCAGKGYITEHREAWVGFSGISYAENTLHFECSTCNGTGEVEVFNPVLPKMRVAGQSQRERKKKEKIATGQFVTRRYV